MENNGGQSPNSSSPAARALLLTPLAIHLCETSWAACVVVSVACYTHFHSRWGLRQLVAATSRASGANSRRRLWRRLCFGPIVLSEGIDSYHEFALGEGDERSAQSDIVIRRDIGRTFPEEFGEDAMEALSRVLRAASRRLEDVGYCQGMNFIAGIFLRAFSDSDGKLCEADEVFVYHCLLSILLRHGMNQYYGDRFPKLRLTALQFDCLVAAFLPELGEKFEAFNLSAEFYATQWFLTLFSYSLPFEYVLQVWDQFLCRGMKFIHRVGLALLQEAQPVLLESGFDGTVQHLRTVGQNLQLSPDELVERAKQFKVTNRLLCELEQGLSSGVSSGGFGPRCFPERDLDTGRTRWRCEQASSVDAAGRPSFGESDGHFLEASLPAPRIPLDPAATLCGFEHEDFLVDSGVVDGSNRPSRHKRFAQLPTSLLRTVRRQSARAAKVAGGTPSSAEPVAQRTNDRLDLSPPGRSKRTDRSATAVRCSSAPTGRRGDVPRTRGGDGGSSVGLHRAVSRPSKLEPPAEEAEGESRAGTVQVTALSEIPEQLRAFAIRDLDTGKWTLPADVASVDAGHPSDDNLGGENVLQDGSSTGAGKKYSSMASAAAATLPKRTRSFASALRRRSGKESGSKADGPPSSECTPSTSVLEGTSQGAAAGSGYSGVSSGGGPQGTFSGVSVGNAGTSTSLGGECGTAAEQGEIQAPRARASRALRRLHAESSAPVPSADVASAPAVAVERASRQSGAERLPLEDSSSAASNTAGAVGDRTSAPSSRRARALLRVE